MAGSRVVVYGLSTEGYAIACHMAVGGAEVYMIDESSSSAIMIKSEVAKTYPTVSAIKDDEIILPMLPISEAVAKAQYLFFSPRIRKAGQDLKTEIHSKLKDATSSLKKNSSIVCCLPTGIGGNNENISLLEHITGFEMGKNASYYYYPLGEGGKNPPYIGSFNGKIDEKLTALLTDGKAAPSTVSLASSEYMHAIDTLTQFSSLCSMLEICKMANDDQTRNDLLADPARNVFLGGMIRRMYDLRTLNSSFEGANTLTSMINSNVKGIEGYVKRLVEEIRETLKKNELKASRARIALAWTMDEYEMRGDRISMLDQLREKLRDHIGEVAAYKDTDFDLFHTDKTTVVVACTRADFESVQKGQKDPSTIIIKANPLCEVLQPPPIAPEGQADQPEGDAGSANDSAKEPPKERGGRRPKSA